MEDGKERVSFFGTKSLVMDTMTTTMNGHETAVCLQAQLIATARSQIAKWPNYRIDSTLYNST